MLGRLDAPQLQPEDEVQVGPTRLLVDGTRVQRERPSTATRGPPAVGRVGGADGVDVDHREGGEEDLRGNSREFISWSSFFLVCLYSFIKISYLLF